MGKDKGLTYFRKLAAVNPSIRSGHTLLAELVASGEILMASTSSTTRWSTR
jgi:iron(III) transport system substrate-binding protein